MSTQETFKRRGFLAAAAGVAAAAAFVRGTPKVEALAGAGDQGNLVLGSNNFFIAGVAGPNRANISSAATVVEASPNFGNFIDSNTDHVFKVDATPADGGIDAIVALGNDGGSGVVSVGGSTGIGVIGVAVSNFGVLGSSATAIGGFFSGGLAPLRLAPAFTGTGPPAAGAHQAGELYVAADGGLFYCRTAGTPGTWVALGAPAFVTLPTPDRFVDTRLNLGGVQGQVPGQSEHTFQMTGRTGASGNDALRIPDTATTIVGNLTVIGGAGISEGSFVTLWPSGSQPTVSNINVGPGQVVANSFVVGLGADSGHGFVNVFNQADCQYILDVTGYYA